MRRAGALMIVGTLLAMLFTAFPGVLEDDPGAGVPGVMSIETAAAAAGPVGASTSRLSGTNRYATAVAVSKYKFADPAAAKTVYLARGDQLTAALVAGTLKDGPVLLVPGECGTVPTVVRDEVARLNPSRVIALGGTASVCDSALKAAAGGRATSRIGSEDRYDTAAKIAARAFPNGSARVYLTRSSVNADGIVGGQLRDGPILLVSSNGTSTPARTLTALSTLGAKTVVALGGPAAVSDAALSQAAAGRTSARLAGADRYKTSVAIAKHAFTSRTTRAYLARGDSDYTSAVSAGMLTDGPVVLTQGPCEKVRSISASFLKLRTPSRVVAVGKSADLCDSTLRGASLAARPKIDCATYKCVALTFDDGPSRYTPTLLNTLASNRIPATFFQLGVQVDAYPQHSRRAYVEGHQVANHTWDHKQLTTLTKAQQQWEVNATDNELNSHGVPDTTLLRPPYGSYNTATRQLGFPLVLWDVDPRDWDGPPSSATVRSRIKSAVRSGSIVLQHDIHVNSVNAVPGIVSDLKAAGYTFVSVSELVPGAKAGDVIYNRTRITPSGTSVSSDDIIVLEDGRRLGPVVDEAPVPGVAPGISEEELLRSGP